MKKKRPMTPDEIKIFIKEFKKFFLDELIFYNNLSSENFILKEFEKYFGKSIDSLYRDIKYKILDLEKIDDIKDFYRNRLGIALFGECKMENEKLKMYIHKFLIEDGDNISQP